MDIKEVNPAIQGCVIKNEIGIIVIFFYETIVTCVMDGFSHINLLYHLIK